MNTVVRFILTLACLSSFQPAFASGPFLPPNDLDREDCLACESANMTQKEFNEIIESVASIYRPVVKGHRAKLQMNNLWTDTTVNASANQSGSTWEVNMYGGLARRKEVTKDGFAMVVCHEVGHHLAGYSFYGETEWAASEGQSDFWATQVCARRVFAGSKTKQAVSKFATQQCDKKFKDATERSVCYRTADASQSLANLLSVLNDGDVPKFTTPDRTEVRVTDPTHPQAQCRLDTYLAGALCGSEWKESLIPGKRFADRTSPAAEREAAKYGCFKESDGLAAHPRCWFASVLP